MKWREVVAEAGERLGASMDARRIAETVCGYAGAEWYDALDLEVSERHLARFDALVERRAAGEPLQYVLGSWGFRTLDLLVDRRVLIPRPETEIVVEAALGEATSLSRPLVAVDLGTGSGAIAISLALELPGDIEVWATDASGDALDVARANLAGAGLRAASVRVMAGSWFDALPAGLRGTIGLIVSNPPYVAASDELPSDVRDWEPDGALVSGPTGLECIDVVVSGAAEWLRPGGVLVVEIGETQGAAVAGLAVAAGLVDVEVRPDLAGRERMLVARHRTDA